MKAYDLLIQAETGLAHLSGPPEAPGRVGVSVSDIAAGLDAYAAILEALYARERSGEGATLSVSLFDATAEWMAVPFLHHEYGGRGPPPPRPQHPPPPPPPPAPPPPRGERALLPPHPPHRRPSCPPGPP